MSLVDFLKGFHFPIFASNRRLDANFDFSCRFCNTWFDWLSAGASNLGLVTAEVNFGFVLVLYSSQLRSKFLNITREFSGFGDNRLVPAAVLVKFDVCNLFKLGDWDIFLSNVCLLVLDAVLTFLLDVIFT